jgi:beta-glucanase (GH16 family)
VANSNGPAGTSPESSKWSFDTGGGGWGNDEQGQAESATPLSAGFHTYSVEWEPERISFMLDGSVYKTITTADLPAGAAWPFEHPYFLLLDLAVGGEHRTPPRTSPRRCSSIGCTYGSKLV